MGRGLPSASHWTLNCWTLAAETLRSEATPNVGPFAPSIIAHTAIIRISKRGNFFLLSIRKSATDESASFRVNGFLTASVACFASVAGSMCFFSFPHLTNEIL